MPTIYYEPSLCNCDGVDYSKADIENAASLALELAKKGRTIEILDGTWVGVSPKSTYGLLCVHIIREADSTYIQKYT
ncbi:hypothetical protein SLS55_007233 [Diplodia seriata]|uniref:Uncharacterized protein n=1 Tax=Diplodia seriata TaxID=420778 RepID=A0ABR3CBQ4_9PEZI